MVAAVSVHAEGVDEQAAHGVPQQQLVFVAELRRIFPVEVLRFIFPVEDERCALPAVNHSISDGGRQIDGVRIAVSDSNVV